MGRLEELGWNGRHAAHFAAVAAQAGRADTEAVRPARVVRVDKGGLLVENDRGLNSIVVSALRWNDIGQNGPAVVGDWLALSVEQHDAWILPRASYLERPSAGRSSVPQPVAANLDVLLIVEPLQPEFSVGRVERLTALARASGLPAWVVATKSDLVAPSTVADTLTQVNRFVDDARAVSIHERDSIADLRAALPEGATIVTMGPSGAGKSSLINALMDVGLVTGGVREGDGKGRHTTTHRHLVAELGLILMDSPGIRAVAATPDMEAVENVFEDISNLGRSCKFSDCSHVSEPDCSVIAALLQGDLDSDRLSRYRRFQRESAQQARRTPREKRADERRVGTEIIRGRRQTMRLKGRGREVS